MNMKRIIKLLPVAAAGVYLWSIWYLRNQLLLVPISEIAKSEPHLTSFQMYVSFEAILLLLLLFLSVVAAVSSLLKYMRLTEGIAWYFTFSAIGASLSVPASIRRSTSMEWVLLKETEELKTVAKVLTIVVILLLASLVVFISQIVTEKYRVRNMLDEMLTTILSVYLLHLLTGMYNTWYMVAAMSVSVSGVAIIFTVTYINKLKSKLEAEKKCGYNINVDEDYENLEEAL